MSRTLRWSALLISLATASLPAQADRPAASAASSRPPLTHADFAKWETLGNGTLSPDGKWITYDIRRVSGSNELRFGPIGSDSMRVVRAATGATFSSDGKWLLYSIGRDSTAEGGGRQGGPPAGGGGRAAGAGAGAGAARNRVAIVDLVSGATTILQDIQSFVLSNDASHVALRRYPTEGRRARGADIVVRNLRQGTDVTLGNVADFVWSDAGTLLAMTIEVDGRTGNGIQLLTAASGTIRTLDASDNRYFSIAWRNDSDDLVAPRSRADSAFVDTSYAVLAWRGLATPRPTMLTYDFAGDASFPRNMRVASYRAPQWSQAGSTLFFGIAPREPKPAPAERRASGAEQPATVEVWHWKDVRSNHQQEVQQAQDRTRTHLVAWHLAPNRLVRLADDSLETVQLSQNQKVAIAADEGPYEREAMFGRTWRDVYRIDIATGKREKIITRSASAPRLSPDGGHVLYTQGGNWWAYDVATKVRSNLTGQIKVPFMNMEDDHPVAERQPYGLAGWTTGEKSVILYDRFDLWQVQANGSSPLRLTRGREDSTVYRRITIDPEERTIDPARPMYLSATGEWTRKSGFARLRVGQQAERLVWLDKGVSALEKAKNADVFLYQAQRYDESPNLFVASAALNDGRQITRTNPFQSDYAWGRQELFTYTNKRGEKLRAMLTYPADYKPGTKYPMVVYFYEKLSNGFHSYIVPTERASYNVTVFSQEGYFVLRPDISFRPRDPGYSALDCVVSAVNAVVARGVVDAKRVGTMGHSWGGYESAFLAAHGKGTFAAAIAGAPLTNLISMYGYTSGNTGAAETGHFEVGQERMQVPLWQDPQAYIRNSTVFAVDSMEVPLLLEAGDRDGNVNHWQSIELYNFARRLGKNVVMLLYNGENHSLAQRNNQIDYHRRQIEWFDHYLKGKPAPAWITEGETYQERQRALRAGGVAAPGAAGSVTSPAGGGGGVPPG